MSLWVWVVAYLAVGVAIPVAYQWAPSALNRRRARELVFPLVILWPTFIVLLGFDVLTGWLERIGRNNDPV